MAELSVDFRTLEELKDLLVKIGLRLHAKNRIGGGESVFIWHLAETLRAAGRLSVARTEEPDLESQFGNGYDAGNIPEADHLDHFLALLRKEMQ